MYIQKERRRRNYGRMESSRIEGLQNEHESPTQAKYIRIGVNLPAIIEYVSSKSKKPDVIYG